MGERQNEPFQLSFNTSLKVDSKDHGSPRMAVSSWYESWMNDWVWVISSPHT